MRTLVLLLSLTLCGRALTPALAQDAAKTVQTSPAGGAAAAAQTLRNEDVLQMLRAGLGAEVVAAKVRASTAREFDTSPAALQSLKAAGVPDAVLLAIVAPAATVAATPPPARPAGPVALPAGTIIDLEAAYDIDSRTVKEGDALSFRVVNPVKVGGLTLIEVGAPATGRVERAKRGGHWGKAGLLVWSPAYVTAADGTRIPLQAMTRRLRGDSKAGQVATQTVVMGALFTFAAPLALLHGFRRGGDAVIPAGMRFEVFVRDAARVQATPAR